MSILKKITLCMLALVYLPLTACADEVDSSSSTQQGVASDDKSLPLFETSSNETYTYQGVEYTTQALIHEGEKYFRVPNYTAWGSFRISGEFDQRIGRTDTLSYVYTMSKDETQSILYVINKSDFTLDDSGYVDLSMSRRIWYIKDGGEFPNPFEVKLTHVQVIQETLVEKKMQVDTLLDAGFETPLCLKDILSVENPVTEIDTRLDMYAIFDLVDYPWLQLGELALYEKDGEVYIRTDSWEEKYYRLNEEYQQLYKGMKG